MAYPKTAGELVLLVAVTVTAGLVAALVRSRRAQLDAPRDRAAALEGERESTAARGAAEERLRIARDVHDLVGHAPQSHAEQSLRAPTGAGQSGRGSRLCPVAQKRERSENCATGRS